MQTVWSRTLFLLHLYRCQFPPSILEDGRLSFLSFSFFCPLRPNRETLNHSDLIHAFFTLLFYFTRTRRNGIRLTRHTTHTTIPFSIHVSLSSQVHGEKSTHRFPHQLTPPPSSLFAFPSIPTPLSLQPPFCSTHSTHRHHTTAHKHTCLYTLNDTRSSFHTFLLRYFSL